MDERRRSPRVWTKFWIALDGIDAELRARTGNISATGICFELDQPVGEPGTVQWVYLSSADRIVSLQIMACVVRSVTFEGKHGAPVKGVALEFMPESDEAIAQLRDFLHYVLALASEGARLAEPTSTAAPGVRAIILDADWSLPVGAPVRVEVIARGVDRTTRVEGRTIRVTRGAEGAHRIEIAVQRELEGPLRRFSVQQMQAVKERESTRDVADLPQRRFTPAHGIAFAKDPPSSERSIERKESEEFVSDALEGLLGTLLDLRTQPKAEHRSHLAGELERIRVPTLLSLIDMEKMTGELHLSRGAAMRIVYFRDGQIVDVDPVTEGIPLREELRRLIAWEDGHFDFTLKTIVRVDRLAMSTMALLLDLAREADEAAVSMRPPAGSSGSL